MKEKHICCICGKEFVVMEEHRADPLLQCLLPPRFDDPEGHHGAFLLATVPMELSAVEMWKKNEPECCVIIFEGAGHCVNMDTPDKFNAAMEEFWLSGYGKY